MFAVLNIIIVIITTGKSDARTWSWLQDDAIQFDLVPFSNPNGGNIPWSKAFLHVSVLRCSMAFFWSFPSDRRFFHCRQQSSPMIVFWECDRININDLKEWYRQKTTDFQSYLLIKMQSLLNSVTYFWKMHQTSNHQISNNKNYFLFLLCQIYIYFSDSNYNFRLWHLVLIIQPKI